MKKRISLWMAGVLAVGMLVPAHAATKDNITVNVDGNPMTIVGHPAVLDTSTGRVLIPFKSLFLAIGVEEKDIKWDAQTSTAKGTKDGTVVELTKNSKAAKVDGQSIQMDNAPIIMGSSMMVPLSFVTKYMGGETMWKGAPDYTVNITMSNGLFPVDVPTDSTTPTQPATGKAPARDTGQKNNAMHGTFALNNMKKDKIVAQFNSNYTVDIRNITTNKNETGSYSVKASAVTITSSILGGSYTLEETTYSGTTYYILKSTDASRTLALAKISYEQFASVYE